ncbi:MAG: hypothetical protein J6Z34_03140 [Clostridia bacterium]|nr:hypothetical protein [Clostridia bacterium]
MDEKGFYKKLNDRWFDERSDDRPKEKKFFGKEKEEAPYKKKSENTGKKRADHKHEYEPAIVWIRSCGEMRSRLTLACKRCGYVNREQTFFRNYERRLDEIPYFGEVPHYEFDDKDVCGKISSEKYKKSVLVYASYGINELAVEAKNFLTLWFNAGHTFLVGDTDRFVFPQKMMADNGYGKVNVAYTGESVKLNIGGWNPLKADIRSFNGNRERDQLLFKYLAGRSDIAIFLVKYGDEKIFEYIKEYIRTGKKCVVCFPKAVCHVNDVNYLKYVKRYYKR